MCGPNRPQSAGRGRTAPPRLPTKVCQVGRSKRALQQVWVLGFLARRSGGPREVPQGSPYAFPGPPGASRRHSGPNASKGKTPRNLKVLTKQLSQSSLGTPPGNPETQESWADPSTTSHKHDQRMDTTSMKHCKSKHSYLMLPYVTQQCFRAGNRASGPDFGWILSRASVTIGLRPAEGRPEGRF